MVKTLNEIIGQCVGEASMLWSELPKGIFESTKGKDLVDRTVAEIRNLEIELAQKEEAHFR